MKALQNFSRISKKYKQFQWLIWKFLAAFMTILGGFWHGLTEAAVASWPICCAEFSSKCFAKTLVKFSKFFDLSSIFFSFSFASFFANFQKFLDRGTKRGVEFSYSFIPFLKFFSVFVLITYKVNKLWTNSSSFHIWESAETMMV